MEVEREEKVVRNVQRKTNGDDEEMFDDVISDCQCEENFLLASFVSKQHRHYSPTSP